MQNKLNKKQKELVKKLAGSWKGSQWDKIDASEWQREIRKYPVRQYLESEVDEFIKTDRRK